MGRVRLHRRVQGEDLFAREAKFHKSCFQSFKLDYLAYSRKEAQNKEQPSTSFEDHNKTAHQKAFDLVLDYLKQHVIIHKEVILLTTLHQIYVPELKIMGVPDPAYPSRCLKERLERHAINSHISFTRFDPGNAGCIRYFLIYNATMSVSEAVEQAYSLGTKNNVMDTAKLLRGLIQKAFSNSTALPWPPTADDLDQNLQEELPQDLLMFLNFVIAGSTEIDRCEKTKRVVLSIGQVKLF